MVLKPAPARQRRASRLRYNCCMARGWESKAVEDQMGAAEAEREARARPTITAEEAALRERRNGLLLSRSRTVDSLAAARDPRYRALLERSLEHLDAELAALE